MAVSRFLLYTTAGSLIWNSVLVTLGVAGAATSSRPTCTTSTTSVVAVVVLAVVWFVYKKASGRLRRPPTAGADLPADRRDQA